MIKVCDGIDKETIAKYENVLLLSSRRNVERALKQRLWMEVNKLMRGVIVIVAIICLLAPGCSYTKAK